MAQASLDPPAPAGSALPGPPPRLPWPVVLAYGAPVTGLAALLFFVQFYFLKYATDVLLAAPAATGLLFGLGRVWDAVSDPLVGFWSDRTRTRLGRRRPWMFGALPVLGASFVMLWSPPESLEGAPLVAWTAVALFAFYTGFTLYHVPHQSLGAELTEDHHDRSRLFGVRHVAWTLGMLTAFGAMGFVGLAGEAGSWAAELAGDRRTAAAAVGLGGALVMTGVLLVPPGRLRERPDYQGRGGTRPRAIVRDVLRNPHARVLLTVWFVEMLGGGVLGVLSPFVAEYVLGRPDLIAALPAVFVVSSILSVPLWVRLSRRFGKKPVWLTAMVGTALSFGGTFFVGEGDVAFLCGLLVVAGSSMGCGGTVGQSLLADVIDWDEWATGERKEGAYSAAWGFVLKLAVGGVTMVTGVVLQAVGFEPNARQSEASLLALRLLFGALPLVSFLSGAFLFRRFALDRAEHARIRTALDARRRSARGAGARRAAPSGPGASGR